MRLEERYNKVLAWFRERMPLADTELQYKDPFQLLVAVILSAQCTDKRVNMVTPALFERFPDAVSMSRASVEEIFELIKSISYPNSKSKHLSAMAKKLVEAARARAVQRGRPDDITAAVLRLENS